MSQQRFVSSSVLHITRRNLFLRSFLSVYVNILHHSFLQLYSADFNTEALETTASFPHASASAGEDEIYQTMEETPHLLCHEQKLLLLLDLRTEFFPPMVCRTIAYPQQYPIQDTCHSWIYSCRFFQTQEVLTGCKQL